MEKPLSDITGYASTDKPGGMSRGEPLRYVHRIDLCEVTVLFFPPVQAVRAVHVNLVDLTQAGIDGLGDVTVFGSEVELSRYTKKTRKVFPLDEAKAGGLLKFLLRRIDSPRSGYFNQPPTEASSLLQPLKRKFEDEDNGNRSATNPNHKGDRSRSWKFPDILKPSPTTPAAITTRHVDVPNQGRSAPPPLIVNRLNPQVATKDESDDSDVEVLKVVSAESHKGASSFALHDIDFDIQELELLNSSVPHSTNLSSQLVKKPRTSTDLAPAPVKAEKLSQSLKSEIDRLTDRDCGYKGSYKFTHYRPKTRTSLPSTQLNKENHVRPVFTSSPVVKSELSPTQVGSSVIQNA